MTISLVKFSTEDGMELDGIFSHEETDRAVVVHIHGKCGNFYQNQFVQVMLRTYRESGIGFLSFNNRGHDCVAEAYVEGKLEYAGGSVEIFEECLLDVEAAMSFVANFGQNIFLQGHSNGCEKALYYATNASRDFLRGIALLSPADSRWLHEMYISPKTLSDQIHELEKTKEGFGFVDLDSYGIDSHGKSYFIPVFRKSLIAMLKGDALTVINYHLPGAVPPIAIPGFVYLGQKDPFHTRSVQEIEQYWRDRFIESRILILNSDHHFHGQELAVAKSITDWISQII